MNKRGQSEVWQLSTIFEILTALVVAAFFVLSALTFNSFTKFDRYYLQEDMKMMVNTLLAAPSHAKYNYSHAKMYDLKLTKDEVEVSKNLKFQEIAQRHHLILVKSSPTAQVGSTYYD